MESILYENCSGSPGFSSFPKPFPLNHKLNLMSCGVVVDRIGEYQQQKGKYEAKE
jgi:hypothetical protein